ncbi:hypothetical protein [Rhizobium leguminosarum]|uniref:hypothetical protein n=1 Tax=Rhizobium leguminosarum TaxID=384 RepID=UPI000484569B|nr:hypothetical protein [Rhizobium leguminosarum]
MADTFSSATHVYPMGSFYQDLDNRIANLETLIGTGEGAVPDFSITQYKLADDALAGKINSAPAASAPASANIIPMVTGAGLVKIPVSDFFTASTFRLKNGSGFSPIINFLGTADRTVTLPNRDVVLDPGWEVIEDVNVTNVSQYVRSGLSAFKELKIVGTASVVTNGQAIAVQVSTDGGATWVSTATQSSSAFGILGGTASTGYSGTNNALVLSLTAASNAYPFAFDMTLFNFNKAVQKIFSGKIALVSYSTGTPAAYFVASWSPASGGGVAVCDAIRVFAPTSNINANFTLLGKRG